MGSRDKRLSVWPHTQGSLHVSPCVAAPSSVCGALFTVQVPHRPPRHSLPLCAVVRQGPWLVFFVCHFSPSVVIIPRVPSWPEAHRENSEGLGGSAE